MKDEWEVRPLGEVCDLSIGRTPSRSDPTLWDSDRQTRNVWVSIADLGAADAGVVSDSREYVSDKGAALARVVPAGTLLLSFKLSLGKVAFAGCDLQTNEAIAALPIRHGVALADRFLYWYLQSVDWQSVAGADAKVKGTTLNKKTLGALPVPIPPLAEQTRIVKILDEALEDVERLQSIHERRAERLGELRSSILRQGLTGRV